MDTVVIPEEHKNIFDLLKSHLQNTINCSAYNWIRPSLWTAAFGGSKNNTDTIRTIYSKTMITGS